MRYIWRCRLIIVKVPIITFAVDLIISWVRSLDPSVIKVSLRYIWCSRLISVKVPVINIFYSLYRRTKLQSEEIVAELVTSFLLPEVQKVTLREKGKYTVISENVFAARPQPSATRPKGMMGRNHLGDYKMHI